MTLGFKHQFVPKILNGTKYTTIREDKKCRWECDKVIHFATGVRTKNYKCFAIGKCIYIADIEIIPKDKIVKIQCSYAGEVICEKEKLEELVKGDGFNNINDFFDFFNKPFKGKIISFMIEKKLQNIEDEK